MYPVGPEYHFLRRSQSRILVAKFRKSIPWHMHTHKRSNNPSKERSKMSKWCVYKSMRSRSAWIMVVCNQTLMSSWVLNRDISISWLELRTAKIGNNSSCKTVSQNSTGKSRPRVFKVENNESKALRNREPRAMRRTKYSHSSDLQIFSVHNDIIKPEQNWKPETYHAIVHAGGRWSILSPRR